MTARVYEVDGQLVLDDPDALGALRAIAKHNCKLTFEGQRERVAHFVQRIAQLGRSTTDVVIVLVNVDDPCGALLAEALMPGVDWQAIRDRGEVPFARGLASRREMQEMLDELEPDAGAKCRAIEVPVIVVDHETVEVFDAQGATS